MTQYNVTGVSNISNMRKSSPISTQLRRHSKYSAKCRCTLPSLPTYYPPKYTFWYLL